MDNVDKRSITWVAAGVDAGVTEENGGVRRVFAMTKSAKARPVEGKTTISPKLDASMDWTFDTWQTRGRSRLKFRDVRVKRALAETYICSSKTQPIKGNMAQGKRSLVKRALVELNGLASMPAPAEFLVDVLPTALNKHEPLY